MRYDNIFWVLTAPTLASCACFASEMFSNFAESWNHCFEELRRGFEMIGGKEERVNSDASFREVRTGNCRNGRVRCGSEAGALDDIRALFLAKLLETRELGSGGRCTEELE